ncbi:hypothetical protein CLIB1423_09S00958 [[Candida] railenensis]|uniref:Uncharacterized protein n=1 Tax=[Candida] railenensis TaxID=45579 RepID=A0A9P0VXX4_9ASCO|nr:hypothetical protein CLIB1423_09S00958 [[Candida] railenensis]
MGLEKESFPPSYETSSSAARYVEDKKDRFEDAKEAEIEALGPLDVNGRVADWNFFIIGYEITTFVSQDARTKYKSLKEVKTKHVLDLQRSGFAIPLLRTDHSWKSLFSHTLLKIFKFVPPPLDQDRLFDPKKDRYEFCIVKKWENSSYNRFEFNFTPNPTKKADNFTLFMIYHRRYPIADISPYKGRRYRWITPKLWSLQMDWAYELHELNEGQDSLIDDLQHDGKVSKSNPLLGSAWKNSLLPQVRDNSRFRGREHGVVVYHEKLYKVSPVRFGYSEPVSANVGEQRELESINSVSDEALVFLCMVSVLKDVEDNRALALD